MRALYDIPAPAKLNLFLHITGRRADGYHLLQSKKSVRNAAAQAFVTWLLAEAEGFRRMQQHGG